MDATATTPQLRLAVDLVNTAARGQDTLGGRRDLRAFLELHGEKTTGGISEEDVTNFKAVRARLRRVFAASTEQEKAAEINSLLEAADVRPFLTDHCGGSPWHLHVTAEDAPWGRWLQATTGFALAIFAATEGLHRIGSCRAPACDRVFIDTSPRGDRRYCSERCANRARVGRLRARRSGARGPQPDGAP
ncbi:MAG TPA: CGNR zinc finger domain-containing protein [Actinomycetota bacterium]|nr:CGNR zinc finger domain-containing protein [Actinomycetota bacterium]